jgi:hypothetical protein
MVLCAWCEGRHLPSHQTHSTTLPLIFSLTLLMMGKCLKHVELILKINKHCYLLHLVGLDFITLSK